MYRLPLSILFLFLITISSCGQSTSADINPPPGNGDDNSIPQFKPIDETQPSGDQDAGFFLDDWAPKEITAPAFESKNKPTAKLDSRIQVDVNTVITKVPRYVYGNNANPYNGQMADEKTLVNYVRDLNPHLIRFPGGNLSNLYFWDRAPKDTPADVPPANALLDAEGNTRTNETYWFGKNNANYTMSLNNYYQLLDETNSKGVITVNFSYARYGRSENPVTRAAKYAADWVRHDNGRTRFWEIGNENYGGWQTGYRIDTTKNKGHQPEFISGKLYAQIANVFIDSMQSAAREIGADIKIGTQIYEKKPKSYETDIIKNWNAGFFNQINGKSDYYIVHNYYTPFEKDSSPSVILSSAYQTTHDMTQFMNRITTNNHAPLKPLALTEWNIFATGSQQMVSNIAGIHAAMTLGNIIKYEYGMACRWDLANAWDGGNDHGMFNASRFPAPDAPDWNPRPAFYQMYFFQKYFGDRMVWSGTQGDPSLKSYASTFSSGQVGLVVANTSDTVKTFDVQFKNSEPENSYYWYILSGGYEKGTYSRNVKINGKRAKNHPGGPENYDKIKSYSANTSGDGGIKLSAPGYSVLYILIDHS